MRRSGVPGVRALSTIAARMLDAGTSKGKPSSPTDRGRDAGFMYGPSCTVLTWHPVSAAEW